MYYSEYNERSDDYEKLTELQKNDEISKQAVFVVAKKGDELVESDVKEFSEMKCTHIRGVASFARSQGAKLKSGGQS